MYCLSGRAVRSPHMGYGTLLHNRTRKCSNGCLIILERGCFFFLASMGEEAGKGVGGGRGVRILDVVIRLASAEMARIIAIARPSFFFGNRRNRVYPPPFQPPKRVVVNVKVGAARAKPNPLKNQSQCKGHTPTAHAEHAHQVSRKRRDLEPNVPEEHKLLGRRISIPTGRFTASTPKVEPVP